MTNNSTESQVTSSNQGLPDAFAKIVDSLVKAITDLPQWAQLGAFFLVIALVATAITSLSLSNDESKLRLIFAFLFGFSLFVLVLYASVARQNKLENDTKNLKVIKGELENATNKLHKETDKRINCLKSIQGRLEEIKRQLEISSFNRETDVFKEQIYGLLEYIKRDLDEVDKYRVDLATAKEIDDRYENSDFYKNL